MVPVCQVRRVCRSPQLFRQGAFGDLRPVQLRSSDEKKLSGREGSGKRQRKDETKGGLIWYTLNRERSTGGRGLKPRS